jgi:7-cyano-7-deazaguanine reductase
LKEGKAVSKKEDDIGNRYRSLDEKVRLEPESEEAIRPDYLITFPFEYQGKDTEVVIETDEFTVLCPWTGLPDFGTLTVRYVPDKECLELKSVKYYLLSYRSVGILQESAANRILRDLVEACRPRSMTVTLDYKVRGGLHSVVTAKHE